MIACATSRVAATTIGLRALGNTWRRMMRHGPAPTARAAATYSRCRMASTWPRTIRAVCIQLVRPITPTTSTKTPASGPSAARSGSRNSMVLTISRGSTGNARNKSVKRISGPSRRRKKPARTPASVPAVSDSAMAVTPTASDSRPPASSRAKVSRPRLSVPSGWAADMP